MLVFPAPNVLETPTSVSEIPPTKGFQKVDLYNEKCYTNLILLDMPSIILYNY
ncbi:MAG: hypothetical protein ACOYMQ_07970 [Pseudanabaena sp.]